MAYNFHPQFMPQTYPQYSQFTPQPPQNQINWVQGIGGAKAYPVGAGNSVLLMDSDEPYLYIKSADNTGLPSLRIFKYEEITEKKEEPKPEIDMNQYVTKEEFEKVVATLKPKKKKIIEVEDDE